MQTRTVIYSKDKKAALTDVFTYLTPPVGAKVNYDGREYVVAEPVEIYIDKAIDPRDDKVTIYVTVTEE